MSFLTNNLTWLFQQLHSFIYNMIPNTGFSVGLTIITFTAIIRVCLLPLTIKQTRSQVKMQEIQPKVKELQTKYKNDPQKLQQETMKLYKENNASPFSGCLPLLIQLPIIWAMFAMFNGLPKEFISVPFLWVSDLSSPDKYYILPILSTITTFISSKMMTPPADAAQAKQTSTMNTTMAVVFGFMSINFKAALVLYWVTQNLFQIGQTFVMKKLDTAKKA